MYERRRFDSAHLHQGSILKTITKRVAELTPREYKQCCSLTMRDWGLMMYSIQEERKDKIDSLAIMVKDGDTLVGWCLMTPIQHTGSIYVTKYARKVSKYSVQFYVRKKNRRQGVARTLMNEALRYDTRPFVIPWDSRSAEFFADYTVTADRERRGLITKAKTRKRKAAGMGGARNRR